MYLKHKRIFALIVKLFFSVSIIHAQNVHDSVKQNTLHLLPAFNKTAFLTQPKYQSNLTGNFYAVHLPFFCNKELQVQKAVGFPVKFRLGSVAYCDKLEGKNR